MELTSPKTVRELMERYNFRWRKRLGQNFLVDANIISKIVEGAEIDKNDIVVEIGPGLGALTKKLAENARIVMGIEVDRDLIPVLEETLQGKTNVHIINEDALKVDLDRLVSEINCSVSSERGYKVVANLPYYITTPLLMYLLENRFNVSTIVVMVQEEVARRITAQPGNKEYGALSVAVQFYTSAEIIGKVSPNVFIPRPEVGSAVVKLIKRESPPAYVKDERIFFSIVRAAFGQRRKTLLNALTNAPFEVTREEWNSIIVRAAIDPGVRGENLGITDFAALTSCYMDFLNGI